ncbi:MAG TPA: aldose 1-epimerase family protein [Ruminiclostridium sp.]
MIDKKNLMRHIGDTSQLFGIKDYNIIGSKADGMRALDVYTVKGLSFTILPDMGMDIAHLNYNGINLSFMSSTGLTGSKYFCEDESKGFLKNFNVGFLTTCGLTYMGAACIDNGEKLGLHGVISNTPAYEVSPQVNFSKDDATISVSGKMKEARMFGENMILSRCISCDVDGTSFKIVDTVENLGFEVSPLMLLYHINFGYPLLDMGSRIILPTKNVIPRNLDAQKGISEYNQISSPIDKCKEQVFFHNMECDKNGDVIVGIINNKLELFVTITYKLSQLPLFTQWKSMGAGEYVLGLEPGNCHVLGRDKAREDGTLQYILPGELKKYEILVNIIHGTKNIDAALRK